MTEIVVVVPVLARPQNAGPLVESFRASEPDARLVFVLSPSDDAECEACSLAMGSGSRDVGLFFPAIDVGPGNYAKKINAYYSFRPNGSTAGGEPFEQTPYLLLAADDLRFHPGWDTALLAVAREYDVGVVGTNDLGNGAVLAGRHSTHPLVSRCYIDAMGGYVGGEGRVYFEGYDHQYCDVELVETAKARGCYAHCHDAVVEHLHPLWRKAADDATYRKGQANGSADSRLYQSRRHLWEREQVRA